MIVIGCTGGIGAGKSTVAKLLEQKGAVVIDADAIARAAIDPDGLAFEHVRAHFGARALSSDGSLDRKKLAAIVFNDASERAELERLIHPVVEATILARLHALAESDDIVVLEIALLVETGASARYQLDGVLVVDAPLDIALERLVTDRGLDEDDARRRIEAQIDRIERLKSADFAILNIGTLEELDQMVDNAWDWMRRLSSV